MFSGIKMEELMKSGIFRVELVTENVVLGSSGIHFMHMRVKYFFFFSTLNRMGYVLCIAIVSEWLKMSKSLGIHY